MRKPFASGEFGLPRLLAALQAHMWSNLKMKDSKALQAAGGKEKAAQEEEEGADLREKETKSTTTSATSSSKEGKKEEESLKEIFGNINLNGDGDEEDEEESFELLFNKMAQLKSTLHVNEINFLIYISIELNEEPSTMFS